MTKSSWYAAQYLRKGPYGLFTRRFSARLIKAYFVSRSLQERGVDYYDIYKTLGIPYTLDCHTLIWYHQQAMAMQELGVFIERMQQGIYIPKAERDRLLKLDLSEIASA